MSEKFTPGPWRINDGTTPGADGLTGPTIMVDTPDGPWIVAVLDEGKEDEEYSGDEISVEAHEETVANAHLIAAAPDLYAACKRAHRDLAKIGDEYVVMELAAAIAKAEGSAA